MKNIHHYFMMRICLTLLLLGLEGIINNARAQRNWGFKYFGLSLHPKGDPNAPLMPLNPDKKGYLVFNLGGMVSYEQFFKPQRFSFKGIQAVYTDCAAQLGGFTHLGLRVVFFRSRRHSLNVGFGPTFIYRRNWNKLPGYQDSGFFKGTPQTYWQYKLIPYAGEIEHNYQLTDKMDFSTILVPGYPDLISLSFGLRFWLDKEPAGKQPETSVPTLP